MTGSGAATVAGGPLIRGVTPSIMPSVVCHDDAITLRAQKHRLGLTDEWWRSFNPTERIYGWFNRESGKSMQGDECPGVGWRPMRERVAKLDGNVWVRSEASFLDFTITHLWGDFASRYGRGVDALCDAVGEGIVGYRPRAPRSSRNTREAMRHRVRSNMVVARYEHDLWVIDRGLGDTMVDELKRGAEHIIESQTGITAYLSGFHGVGRKDKPMLVKAYQYHEGAGADGGGGSFAKVEVSLRSEWVKRHGMRGPDEWRTPDAIQDRIAPSLVRVWERAFKGAPMTSSALAERMGVPQGELFATVARHENTLTDLVRRVERLEDRDRRIDELAARLTILERERADGKREH